MFWQRDVIIPSQIKHSSCEWWPCRITMAKEFSEEDALLIFHFLHTRTSKHFARGDGKYFCSVPYWHSHLADGIGNIISGYPEVCTTAQRTTMFLPQKWLQYSVIDEKSKCIAIICFINIKFLLQSLFLLFWEDTAGQRDFPLCPSAHRDIFVSCLGPFWTSQSRACNAQGLSNMVHL